MKTILITGGSRGIGSAIVRESIGKYKVAFTYNKNKELAENIVSELSCYGEICAVKCDISSSNEVNEMVKEVHLHFGKIDILVNSAGIAEQKLFQDITDEDWRRMFSVNVDGTFFVTKAFLPDFLDKQQGAIINISSMWGEVGSSLETHYSASKSAIIGLTKALAKELAPSNITVNAVSPGAIETDMMSCFSDEDIAMLCQEIPLGRLGTAKDVAHAVLYLCENRYVTGQVLDVNGGMVM